MKIIRDNRMNSYNYEKQQGGIVDEVDDLEAKKCPKCKGLMIKQEIDESWFCENCDKPHG